MAVVALPRVEVDGDGTGPRAWAQQSWTLLGSSRVVSVPSADLNDTSFTLGPMPGDFESMASLTVTHTTFRTLGPSDDACGIGFRIMAGATVLAAADAAGAFSTYNFPSTIGSVGENRLFAYVNTTATKAMWDAAEIQIRQTYTVSMGNDGNSLGVATLRIGGHVNSTYISADTGTLAVDDSVHRNTVDGNLSLIAPGPPQHKFVAGGSSGAQYESPDGLNWTAVASSELTQCVGLAYLESAGRYAQSYSNLSGSPVIKTSPDLVTFTPRTSGFATDESIIDIGASEDLGQFVAVGENLSVSSNAGITWAVKAHGFGTSWMFCAQWVSDLGLWIVGAEHGKIATSPDGNTWTQQTTPTSVATIDAVAWSSTAGILVAITSSDAIWTSPDGINWTSRAFVGASGFRDLTWSPDRNLFVVVGDTGKLYTSSDGINWTSRTSSFGTTDITDVVWSQGLGIFLAGGSNKMATSTDGISWTNYAGPMATLTKLLWTTAPVVVPTPTLDIAPAAHGHAAGSVTLNQSHVLAVSEATHAHSVDIARFILELSAVQDALHGHAISGGEVRNVRVDLVYADAHLVGTVASPANVLGAPNDTWSSNAAESWDSRFSMADPSAPLDGLQTVSIEVRKDSGTGSPTITVELWENGVFVKTLVLDEVVT